MKFKLIAAGLAVCLMAAAATSAKACNPKTDPGCDRGVPTLTGPLACNPKTDPGCN